MIPGMLGLVHFIEKGYLADPFGTVRKVGAEVITALEHCRGTS
jgi:hypothetical protein